MNPVPFCLPFRLESLQVTEKAPAEAPEKNQLFVDAAMAVSLPRSPSTFVQISLSLHLITPFLFPVSTLKTPSILGSLVPTFPQTAPMEEPIIEVLKYSQKDMDAAIAKVQEEVGLASRLD